MIVRPNHRDMSPAAKADFVKAVLALKNDVDSVLRPGEQKRYDDFVEVHKNAMLGPDMFMPMPHGTPLFFPWHRVLLLQFEADLRKIVSTVVLPYWDWDLTGTSNPFTSDFMGGDGDSAQNDRVTEGPFASQNGKFPIRVWDDTTGNEALRREFGEAAQTSLPSASDIEGALGNTPYWGGAGSWEKVCEGGLHNPVHRWVGGNMADATSPNDPVFFLHHAYIDYLWEKWKGKHPASAPYLPKSGSSDYDLTATLVFNASNKPAPWSQTYVVAATLKPSDLGYTYQD